LLHAHIKQEEDTKVKVVIKYLKKILFWGGGGGEEAIKYSFPPITFWKTMFYGNICLGLLLSLCYSMNFSLWTGEEGVQGG
jgi:hypothetical protein